MPARTTRSSSSASPRKKAKATPAKRQPAKKAAKKTAPVRDAAEATQEEDEESISDGPSDVYEDSESPAEDDDDSAELDSDALDEDEDDYAGKKRKRSPKKSPKKKPSPRKKAKADVDEDEEFDEEGRKVVGVVIQAPKTGKVPPGQISRNTLNFLRELQDPAKNDRDWFRLHEPVYRAAEQEWKDFVSAFGERLSEVDTQVPPLPPKDVIHRVYRDIRFSNDKTPYKQNFSASFSRSGRKGIFAAYHISLKPGNESFLAAGSWCPGKNELATIRAHIQRSPRRLRRILAAPAFVSHFGPPEPAKHKGNRFEKGSKRQSVWGREDELKNAPKGVEKDHPDIDLLRLRSFAVSCRFTDEEVLDPGFVEKLASVAADVREFVHCLNDMMTLPADGAASSDEEADE